VAAACTVQDSCPECGLSVPITVEFRATTHTSEGLVLEGEPDLTDVMAHAWTHEQ
jgi:hypothetical protein